MDDDWGYPYLRKPSYVIAWVWTHRSMDYAMFLGFNTPRNLGEIDGLPKMWHHLGGCSVLGAWET